MSRFLITVTTAETRPASLSIELRLVLSCYASNQISCIIIDYVTTDAWTTVLVEGFRVGLDQVIAAVHWLW